MGNRQQQKKWKNEQKRRSYKRGVLGLVNRAAKFEAKVRQLIAANAPTTSAEPSLDTASVAEG
jgi:hypothetical protein